MNSDGTQLGYKERDKLFKKYFVELKIKVTLNWFELIALLVLSFIGSFKLVKAMGVSSRPMCMIAAFFIAIVFTLLFSYIRKYKLKIDRFDKERIYKRVSSELHENLKSN